MPNDRRSRAQQREATQERVLAAARHLFAEAGYERTTIRRIATNAQTDPSLVIRYFGSKDELFNLVTRSGDKQPRQDHVDHHVDLVDRLQASITAKLASEPTSTLAFIRSVSSHPPAAAAMRTSITTQHRALATELGGSDADLRVAVFGALSLGLVFSKYLLQLDGITDASHEQLNEVLSPVMQALLVAIPPVPPELA